MHFILHGKRIKDKRYLLNICTNEYIYFHIYSYLYAYISVYTHK